MNSQAFRCLTLLALVAVFNGFSVAAESKPLRVAVGPFFAPPANDALRQASQLMPELLGVELSQSPRFQLVEREKIQSVWNELNLSSASLVSRDTVMKFGQVIACDWLISGTLVQADGRTVVWTKVIDVRNGTVVDLNATPYEGVVTNVVTRISKFLGQAGLNTSKTKPFITLGRFVQMGRLPNAPADDWTGRLATLIEKHALDSGFGVAELAAVSPLFEERRLEKAGLTGHPEGRVKLQAAFWLVDGGWEWIGGESLRLAVGLRVQQVGGPAQMFRFTNAPNQSVEKELFATLAKAMAHTNVTATSSPNPEADLLTARGMELATLRTPFPQARILMPSAGKRTAWDEYKLELDNRKRREDHRNLLLATYERSILQDPKNMEATFMLGYALIVDPAKRERGRELLRAVVASKDPKRAGTALHWLTNISKFEADWNLSRQPPPRPRDLGSLRAALAETPDDVEIKCDLGAALRKQPNTGDRELGRRVLAEVAEGQRADQADRARKLLAEPEPPLPPPPAPRAQPPPGYYSQEQANQIREAQLQARAENESPEQAARRKFLQENFDKFVPVKFESDKLDSALFQTLQIAKNRMKFDGRYYSGFRFVVPAWYDGDFLWTHVFDRTLEQANFITDEFEWYIVPREGKMVGFEDFKELEVQKYAGLKKRFPYTERFYCQRLAQERLTPGKEYAIWFGFNEKGLPDLSFALTITSTRGQQEIGPLPVR